MKSTYEKYLTALIRDKFKRLKRFNMKISSYNKITINTKNV